MIVPPPGDFPTDPWQDIPANIHAILLPAGQAVDTLSHVAIRARNQEVPPDGANVENGRVTLNGRLFQCWNCLIFRMMWGYPPVLGSNQFTAHIKHKSRYTNCSNYEPTDLTKGQPLRVPIFKFPLCLWVSKSQRLRCYCMGDVWILICIQCNWKMLKNTWRPKMARVPKKTWVPQGSISIPVAIPTSLRVRSCWPVVMRINNSSSCDRCDLDSPEVAVVLNFDGSGHGCFNCLVAF